MADIKSLISKEYRKEEETLFSGHSGDVYLRKNESEDGAFEFWEIFAASPTTSNFNDAPIGSELTNTANGVKYRKTGATTWAQITQV